MPEKSDEPVGSVDVCHQSEISGFVRSQDGAAVKVELRLNGRPVAATWAVGSENCKFRFNVKDLWKYCGPADALSVAARGDILDIVGYGQSFHPTDQGSSNEAELRRALEAFYVFNQKGRLQLSKTKDVEWRDNIIALFLRLERSIKEKFDIQLSPVYGTLLGAVRQGDYIGHDHDFDAAYISKSKTGKAARAELKKIASHLLANGFQITPKRTCLWVSDKLSGGRKIDIFHLYFKADGELAFPFGFAGEKPFLQSDFAGYKTVKLGSHEVMAVAPAERLVETIYGSSWRTPNPGFSWNKDRKERDRDGIFSDSDVQILYWDSLYAKTSSRQKPSAFSEFVISQKLPCSTVIDFGAGDGRDTFAFADAGYKVIAADRSQVACALMLKDTQEPRISVRRVDVYKTLELKRVISDAKHDTPDGQVLIYARFLLHALGDTTRKIFLRGLHRYLTKNDYIAFEFRTKKDESRRKHHKDALRYYLDTDQTIRELQDIWGFKTLLWQEGSGFAPYNAEDPIVCRVICKK